MTGSPVRTGWERLPCGCDVELRHGIPVRLSSTGETPGISAADMAGEVAALTGLRVNVGEWLPGDDSGELQAEIHVTGEQFTEVLNRLARSAATIFFDRYRKPVDRDDVDWDTLEYANDFRRALQYCGLDWQEVDREASKATYLEAMHTETRRLASATNPPPVEPELD